MKSGYFKSRLGCRTVDWFVDEIIKLENKTTFYLRKTKKDIIMKQEDTENFENKNIRRFCEKTIESSKVRDLCQLTGKYKGPAQGKCNINVKQSQSNFLIVVLQNFSNYDYHLFF